MHTHTHTHTCARTREGGRYLKLRNHMLGRWHADPRAPLSYERAAEAAPLVYAHSASAPPSAGRRATAATRSACSCAVHHVAMQRATLQLNRHVARRRYADAAAMCVGSRRVYAFLHTHGHINAGCLPRPDVPPFEARTPRRADAEWRIDSKQTLSIE